MHTLASNPYAPSVISGDVQFHERPLLLEVVASDSSIIEWQKFHIDPQETIRFIQPNADSTVLNRVLDFAPSNLMGRLESNGQVLIVNPNGILIGRDAFIDTGSFIATTLDLQNDFFLNQDWKFEGNGSAAIIHKGLIRTKRDVFLFGDQIASSGRIEAENVWFVAGNQMGFTGKGSERIHFRTSSDSSLSFDGNIRGKNAYLFANQIAITSHAKIDVSHDYGGGTILVGGDYRGENGHFSNAHKINVEKGAAFNASSIINGSGGKVIFWGEETTAFHGSIFAEGGEFGGNGGFVEVSGKILDFQGKVLALAPKGKAGTFLLDPVDVIIGAGVLSPACGVNNPAANTTFDNGLLSGLLGGCSVTIQTSGGAGGSGNITVNAPVTWASGTVLTLHAANNITINAGGSLQESSAANTGGVVLIAPDTATITINGTNVAPTSVGSQNGITMIGDPSLPACSRSHPNLRINGGGAATVAGIGARLGFSAPTPPAAFTATGAIDVTCGNLLMIQNPTSAQIGHGGGETAIAGLTLVINAPITVSASGTITLTTALGLLSPNVPFAAIGNGGFFFSGPGSSLRGDINVTAGGNILLENTFRDQGSLIGHFRTGVLAPGNVDLLQGDIIVSSGGSVTLNSFNSSATQIGHYTGTLPTLASVGNIYVSALIDVNLIGVNNTVIGHFTNIAALNTVNSEVNVVAGNDVNLLMTTGAGVGARTVRCFIGSRVTNPANLTGDVKVYAGRDLNMRNQSAAIVGAARSIVIGHFVDPGSVNANGNSNTFVGVSRNLNFLNPNTRPLTIQATGNVYVGVSGNILSTTTSQTNFISTANNSGAASTSIWAGGNITGTTTTFFGSITGVGQNASIDIRAGGTITYPNNFNTSQGSFFMAAPTFFDTGQLWTTLNNPSRLESACLTGSATSISFNNCFTSVVTLINSPQNIPAVTTVFPPVTITTTTGPITLSSPLSFGSGNPQTSNNPSVMLTPCSDCTFSSQDLILGAGSTQIATTSGDITIGTFRDILVNQALTTSGNIDITACRTLNANSNISTTASGFVHLVGANVNISGGVNTVNGPICTLSGGTTNITSDMISTGGGTISSIANTLLISSTISSSNSILLISQNMHLFAPADISSTGSTVTLVVDNDHPAPPLPANASLLGTFLMDAGTSISTPAGFPLSIFTALQNLNTISGTLNGMNFLAGTLFTDTANEIWCSFPPPFINCNSCSFQMGCTQNCPGFFIFPNGSPFTIYYKNCLQQVTQEAQLIVAQLNENLHPYNEFPGWCCRFMLLYKEMPNTRDEPFLIRRRHLSFFNHPKTYTQLSPY